MYKRNIDIYIKDIIENMNKAEKFVKNLTYKNFVNDERTHYAVIRCIEIIGEAAKHIPEKLRKKYPQIPWKDMAGMRDKVIHIYFGVNPERVWLVVKQDFPPLKPTLRKILKDIKSLT